MVDHVNRFFAGHAGTARFLVLTALAVTLTLVHAGTALAGPSRVLLGTAGDFGVLGGSGLTNTGTTTIVGDVGSSPTASATGFGPCPATDCVALTGRMHDDADPNDAVTQQAKSDLVTAYDDAFGRTGGTAVSAPLGGGMTLVSGVYTSAADIFVGGDLTLDGGGDPDAVFIFQAKTGTLKTAAGTTSGIPNTRVLLSNGAQACNVFWQVGSSATIETFTQFVGNVMAMQSITVNTRATLDTGSVLARNGAVTLDTNTIKRTACATSSTGTDGTTTPPTTTTSDTSTDTTEPSAGTPTDELTPETPVVAGRARLRGPTGPVTGPFRVRVTGRAIRKVAFFLDGKRVRVVRARPGQRKFRLRINPRGQSYRTHRVVARVRFTPESRTSKTTRRYVYHRKTSAPTPRFAG